MGPPDPARALFVGADEVAGRILRESDAGTAIGLVIVGQLTVDDPIPRGIVTKTPGSYSIAGLQEILRTRDISHLLFAPSVDGPGVRATLDACGDRRLRLKAVVGSGEGSTVPTLRELEPEDLVQRRNLDPIDGRVRRKIAGRCALVTGAAGTIGAETSRQLLDAGVDKLVVLDRDAGRLRQLRERLVERFPGTTVVAEHADIRNAPRLRSLLGLHAPHDVIHAAAQKHLPELESTPCSAAWTNVLGTQNVVAAAIASGTERFVYVSTDKAVRPSSVMGASKRIGEEIVRASNLRSRTRFVTVRFGNVIGSSSSVVPTFQQQIAAGGPVGVTHPEVSRFFMTRAEAAALLLQAAHSTSGDLLVLDMGTPIRIVDLARYLIRMAGLVPGHDVDIDFIGLRPGEKLHEDLLGSGETARRDHPDILSVQCPRGVAGLESSIRDLAEAVRVKNDARALDLLRRLAPGYAPRAEPSPGPCPERDASHPL